MPLIDVNRIVIEEIDGTTFDVIQGGESFTFDCNISVDMNFLYEETEEKTYRNEDIVVAHNANDPIIHGVDLSINMLEFTLAFLQFVNGGYYKTGITVPRNLLRVYEAYPVDDPTTKSFYYDMFFQNSSSSRYYVMPGLQDLQTHSGVWLSSTELRSPSIDIGTDVQRLDGNSFVSDTSTNDYLKTLGKELPNRTTPGGSEIPWFYDCRPVVPTANPYLSNSWYKNGVNVWQAQYDNNDPIMMVEGTTYNIICILADLNTVDNQNGGGSTSNNASETINYWLEYANRFGTERQTLEHYITLDPNAVENFKAAVSGGLSNSSAEIGYNDWIEHINNDPYKLDHFDLNPKNSNHKAARWIANKDSKELNWTKALRLEYQYTATESNIPLVLNHLVFTRRDGGNSGFTSYSCLGNIIFPYVSVASTTVENATINIMDTYQNEKQYIDDIEIQKGGGGDLDGDLEMWEYKSPIGKLGSNRRLFKTTLYVDNYIGGSKEGMLRFIFPVCYSDPINLQVSQQFSDYALNIHSRDEYIENKSAVYVKHVNDYE